MASHKAAPHLAEVSAVDRNSGEVMQLELLNSDTLQGLGKQRDSRDSARYDWRPHTGRHINVPKTLLRAIWDKDSGYTQNDRDILGFYLGHCPEGTEPLRMTFKEISQKLGIRPDAVAKGVTKLHRGNILVLGEVVGRMKFYKLNPRAAFDGPATAQNEATQETRFPEVPLPAKSEPAKRTKKEAS